MGAGAAAISEMAISEVVIRKPDQPALNGAPPAPSMARAEAARTAEEAGVRPALAGAARAEAEAAAAALARQAGGAGDSEMEGASSAQPREA